MTAPILGYVRGEVVLPPELLTDARLFGADGPFRDEAKRTAGQLWERVGEVQS